MAVQQNQELLAENQELRSRIAELEKPARLYHGLKAELKAQRRFSRTLFNGMHDAIYVVSGQDYNIVDCNQVFLSRYKAIKEDVLGRPCHEVKRGLNVPCEMADELCPSLNTFRSGEPSVNEWVYHGGGGEVIVTECRTFPLLNEAGEVVSIVHIDRDLTHRRRDEQMLEEANKEMARSNAFLRNLIMSSVDAVIAADMKGKVLIFNEAAGFISGYSVDEAVGVLDIRDIYPGDGAREMMTMLRSDEHGSGGKLSAHETHLRTKDGSRVPIRLSAAVVMDGDQEVATVGFFYDLREKQRMERELDKTRLQLLQAEKMASIGKLAAGVAHQLNNPLSGITLFAKLLLEEYDLEEQAKDDVHRILMNAKRCRDTIKELLQFARQTQRDMRPTDINRALKQTLFLLENQAIFHDVRIVEDLEPRLPLAPADVQQLSHVFMNLILNAADAMDGKGRLTLRTMMDAADENIVVEIADTGPGIPDEIMNHLFEPFYTTKDEGKGTGLGLSVAYGIIENHCGRLWAQSLPAGGSSFFIELPVKSPMENDDDQQ